MDGGRGRREGEGGGVSFLPQAVIRKGFAMQSLCIGGRLSLLHWATRHMSLRTPPSTLRLPDKVAADPEGRLVFFGHTDVGMLNNVVELWRYPSAQSCIK